MLKILKIQKRIEILSSKKFAGRGYVEKQATCLQILIADELSKMGLLKFGDSYFQEFSYPVNTFPVKITCKNR